MLGYLILVVLLIALVNASVALQRRRSAFATYGVTSFQVSTLQFSLLLYALSLLAFVAPVSLLRYLAPIPFGLLLLVPGIVLGWRIAAKLDTGMDSASQASRVASNVFWLGLATFAIIAGNMAVRCIFRNFGG
jgi:hypothetical protein